MLPESFYREEDAEEVIPFEMEHMVGLHELTQKEAMELPDCTVVLGYWPLYGRA